jgi:hypothetical protein
MSARNRSKPVLTLAVVAMAALVLTAGSASAELLVYEPFAYPDGWLTGQGGALGTTGTWTAHDTYHGDWRIHQEGDTSGIVVDPGPPVVRNSYDGTVANLATTGGYVGLPGPLDLDPPRGEDEDFEIGRHQAGHIALAPSVTATFQTGTTTWFSFVSTRAWDRNEHGAHLIIGTDPDPNEKRGVILDNDGSGIGGGNGPPSGGRTRIFPQYFSGGFLNTAMGTGGTGFNDLPTPTDTMPWDEWTPGGDFGPPCIVVGKIQWDADTGGEDIISLVRFLQEDVLSEAAFDALITAQPGLSSANWESNKPDLDQSQFDLITFAGTKFFIDEIRIATTFEEVTVPEPATMGLLALGGLVLLARRRRNRA